MDIELRNRYLFSQELVKEVGKIALDFYLNRKELKIECKKAICRIKVSIADKTVEAKIKDALKQYFPQDGFLGEESGAENLACEYCWVVDPIDGTSPFFIWIKCLVHFHCNSTQKSDCLRCDFLTPSTMSYSEQ